MVAHQAKWFRSIPGMLLCLGMSVLQAEDWTQFQNDAQRSGNAVHLELPSSIGLIGVVPLSDGIYSSPVVAGNTVYVVDGSGVIWAIDAIRLKVRWKYATAGGSGNCNNVSSPAIVGDYLHVGTMAGFYYVLDRHSGKLVQELDCQEAIFASPVVGDSRVYFATLGAQVFALEPDGTKVWSWDFVRQVIGFEGDRWKGDDWLKQRPNRVTWRDHFVCSREICLIDKTLVIPAGGRTLFLEDRGNEAHLKLAGTIPDYDGSEYPATFGQSADQEGNVYVQWHRRDNAGRVEKLRLVGDKLETSFVPGTQTAIQLPGLLSFAAVSVRNGDVYRVRPEQGMGLCRHAVGRQDPDVLCSAPSIASPVLTKEHAIYADWTGSSTSSP